MKGKIKISRKYKDTFLNNNAWHIWTKIRPSIERFT